MCGGGGGGDPGAEARRQEQERQARVKAATEIINNIFENKIQNSRDKQYSAHRNAVYDINKIDLDKQAAQAERANRFGLARSGLLGGSANIDSVADINRRTNEGLMKVGGIAGQAEADLKTADERTRSNLLSMAQSGIDTGTASQQALKGLEVNSANAAGARSASTIGRLFDDMSQAYLMRQIAQSQQLPYSRGASGGFNPRMTYGGD